MGALAARGVPVVLSGSASVADGECVATVMSAVEAGTPCATASVLNAAGRLDLNQLAELLAGARLYIGPDTSITHLAAACAVPVIALYGPVDPRIFGPWPQRYGPRQP